ncbi:hypothetical protein E4U54_000481, partial [Claviceps lovelessii]
ARLLGNLAAPMGLSGLTPMTRWHHLPSASSAHAGIPRAQRPAGFMWFVWFVFVRRRASHSPPGSACFVPKCLEIRPFWLVGPWKSWGPRTG